MKSMALSPKIRGKWCPNFSGCLAIFCELNDWIPGSWINWSKKAILNSTLYIPKSVSPTRFCTRRSTPNRYKGLIRKLIANRNTILSKNSFFIFCEDMIIGSFAVAVSNCRR